MYKDPEEREREIRNISTVFEQLAEEILPQLRYSRITASIDVIGKSDSEINKCFDNDPSKLSIEELLYAATLTDDNARRMSIYETATRQYPNDYRGWNDLGLTQYVARDYDKAKASFERAAQLVSPVPSPSSISVSSKWLTATIALPTSTSAMLPVLNLWVMPSVYTT